MCIQDWLNLLMVIATFLAVIVALFGEKLWDWLNRPKIRLSFDKNSERCLRTGIALKDSIQDDLIIQGTTDIPRYFYQLKVVNEGGFAKNVKIKLDIHYADDSEKPRFEPSTLKWVGGTESEDFAKGEVDYINICSQVIQDGQVTANSPLRVELYNLHPRAIAWDLGLADYIFVLFIHGDNLKPFIKKFKFLNPAKTDKPGDLQEISA